MLHEQKITDLFYAYDYTLCTQLDLQLENTAFLRGAVIKTICIVNIIEEII
jgi:hypothetical protein